MPHSHLNRSHHFLQSHSELHVIVVCFNPHRFVSRYTLAFEFIERAKAAGAKVTVAEVAFGERPYEVIRQDGTVHEVECRSAHELWLKECIINAAVARLPHDWKYVAWVDADVAFTNPHWAQETIQQLQHHPIVQMFHTALDLGPDNQPIVAFKGFPASVLEDGWNASESGKGRIVGGDAYGYYVKRRLFHPGYAWACRRDAWDAFGGLLDINIIGGGDRQMAYGFYGRMHRALFEGASAGYREAVMAWQEHALTLKKNVGFVPGTLLHYWHGKKVNRRYFDRWKILASNAFDPRADLKRDWHGLWQLAGNKIGLRDDLMAYFRSRQEDSIDR